MTYDRKSIMERAWDGYRHDRQLVEASRSPFGYWLKIAWTHAKSTARVEALRADRQKARDNGLGFFVPAYKEVWTPFGMKRI